MPRKIEISPPKLEPPRHETCTIELKTITPMFGGSATTREVDAENPIRPASVRGHLRFWWRAMAGARYVTPEELFKAEEKIWGSAEHHGKTSIQIADISPGTRKSYSDFVTGFGDARGYALFPFAENRREGKAAAICIQDVSFTILLTCPNSFKAEVEEAVAAWVRFGGIGARTRRGCGSLEFASTGPTPSPPQRLHSSLLTLAPSSYLIGERTSDPVAAWRKALELYREFRQGVPFARHGGRERNRPGRSKWPEADSIRRLAGRNSASHTPSHLVNGFPKADLGLPIVFHFKDEREGDPTDHTLESTSTNGTRFASPVITKAIKVDGGYVPAIILLDAPHVWEAEAGDLKFEKQGKTIPRAQVELTQQERENVPPLKGLPIREALIAFAKTKGFKEVRL